MALLSIISIELLVWQLVVCAGGLRSDYSPGDPQHEALAEVQVALIKFGERLEKVEEQIQELSTVPRFDRNPEWVPRFDVSPERFHGSSMEQLSLELVQTYNELHGMEKEQFFSRFELQKCQPPSPPSCEKELAFLHEALIDPCRSAWACEDESIKNNCIRQKMKFVQWTQVLCSKKHQGESQSQVLSCIRSGLDLLFATDNKVRAKEFAQAPPNKKHLVLWTRVAPDIRKTLLADIPLGFRLEETLLGAVAKLPGVEDLEGCSWAAQKSMWASNSASLIQEMKGGSEVYFVSGINLLEERGRPYGNTVAFKLELPQLYPKQDHVAQLTVVNLHHGTDVEHLCTAVRLALEAARMSEAYSLPYNQLPNKKVEILLKKANCGHCAEVNAAAGCMAKCVHASLTFTSDDLRKVIQDVDVMAKLIGGAPAMTEGYVLLLRDMRLNLNPKGSHGHTLLQLFFFERNLQAVMLLSGQGGFDRDVGKSRSQLFSDLLSAINRQDTLQLKLTLAVSRGLRPQLEQDLDPRNQEIVRQAQQEMEQEVKSLRSGFL